MEEFNVYIWQPLHLTTDLNIQPINYSQRADDAAVEWEKITQRFAVVPVVPPVPHKLSDFM